MADHHVYSVMLVLTNYDGLILHWLGKMDLITKTLSQTVVKYGSDPVLYLHEMMMIFAFY